MEFPSPKILTIKQKESIMKSQEISKVRESRLSIKIRVGHKWLNIKVDLTKPKNIISTASVFGIKGFSDRVHNLNARETKKLFLSSLLVLNLLKKDEDGKLSLQKENCGGIKVFFKSSTLRKKKAALLDSSSFKIIGLRPEKTVDGRDLPITFDWLEAEWQKKENQDNLKTLENVDGIVMNSRIKKQDQDFSDFKKEYLNNLKNLCGGQRLTEETFEDLDKYFRKDSRGIVALSGRCVHKKEFAAFLNQMGDVVCGVVIPVVTTFNEKIDKLNQKVDKLEYENRKLRKMVMKMKTTMTVMMNK